jgi:hypothetical protein
MVLSVPMKMGCLERHLWILGTIFTMPWAFSAIIDIDHIPQRTNEFRSVEVGLSWLDSLFARFSQLNAKIPSLSHSGFIRSP